MLLKFLILFLAIFSSIFNGVQSYPNLEYEITPQNGCISFTVGQGTGCNWMCNYCSVQLSTNNYYFTDGVCTYQTGGCVGNPVASKEYTCCSVDNKDINYKKELIKDEL